MKPHEYPRINKKSIRGLCGIGVLANTPIPHRPRIPRIDKYLDSWLNRTDSGREDLNWFAQSVVSSCSS